jgi:D-alanyl-lipoteichoic acid acyltransferase DltB (MBOAT superfamily)
MGCLGRRLPERYHFPFLARDPLDLWRRWNTYLGLWLQRYVFYPLAMRWQRGWRRAPRDAGKAAAVMVTFAAAGLVHELAGYARSFTLPLGAVLGFLLCGVGLVLWLVVERLAGSIAVLRPLRALMPLWRLVSAALTSTLLLLFGWVALPALAGFGLPPQLLRLLGL